MKKLGLFLLLTGVISLRAMEFIEFNLNDKRGRSDSDVSHGSDGSEQSTSGSDISEQSTSSGTSYDSSNSNNSNNSSHQAVLGNSFLNRIKRGDIITGRYEIIGGFYNDSQCPSQKQAYKKAKILRRIAANQFVGYGIDSDGRKVALFKQNSEYCN